jgi:hypothetical protein
VYLLLHADPDWRWMQERDDSPWYPTMRLFRQQRAGDWQPVVQKLTVAVRALTLDRQNKSCDSGIREAL